MRKDPLGTAVLTRKTDLWEVMWHGKVLCNVPTLNDATEALSKFGFVSALRRGNTNDRPCWTTDIYPRSKR